MAMQEVKYEFPDEKEQNSVEIEIQPEETNNDVEVEGAVGREAIQAKPSNVKDAGKIKTSELEIEVEDDTPPEDRNREPSPPPEEVTEEELESYSEKVGKRIKKLSKGYHDERRAKEQALREHQAAVDYAKTLLEENKKLRSTSTKSQSALIESAKRQVESELAVAKRAYKDAYEAGEPDALLEAQQALNTAQIRLDRVNAFKAPQPEPERENTLQYNDNNVQTRTEAPPPQTAPVDTKAEAWREDNPWFGSDDEMTAFALGYHNKLVKEGVDPQSDEYYEKINSRMRKVFPEQFDDGIDEPEEPRNKSTNVVAPATRSTAPTKIKLTESQVALAKRLNVPLDVYAKQVANLQRNR